MKARFLFVFLFLIFSASLVSAREIKVGKYAINSVTNKSWIEDKDGKVLVKLKSFKVYDQGKKLKLYSNLGHSLDNIPINNEIYFNECIDVLLEGEKELPRTYWCLRNGGFSYRSLHGLRFSFPKNPERHINKNGLEYTRFRNGDHWVVGMAPRIGSNTAYVTMGPGKHKGHSVIAHEYVHMCGYSNGDHDKPVFNCAIKK